MKSNIIVVDANVSLKPYLRAAKETSDFESQMEKMGFEVQEVVERPKRKIGFLASIAKREN
jgi:hypothetical protein|tara:strand:- start:1068 stop:1250 length:183 start_codon:yes stop_codon:yes gene_type:complete